MQRKVVTHLAFPLPLFIHTQQCRQLHQQLHHEQHTNSIHKPINYDFSKILILNKITRYEFEKLRNPHLNEIELKEKLTRKGSNFERLIEHHNTHMRSLEKIIKTLKDYRIDTRVTQRYNYTYDDINWSNCVLTAGGDGTFLMAAAKVNTQTKPVIGINTDVSK
jgi:NAD+ kinase